VDLAIDLLAMDLTNDPDPVRSGAGITVRHGFVAGNIEKDRQLKRQINRIRKKIINI
jgi:hypothetical protein